MCVKLFLTLINTKIHTMPYANSYNEQVANTLHSIYRNKIDHEDLHNDNLAGGSGFAAGYHLDSGYGPTIGITSTSKTVPLEKMMDSLTIPRTGDDELDGAGKHHKKEQEKGYQQEGYQQVGYQVVRKQQREYQQVEYQQVEYQQVLNRNGSPRKRGATLMIY